jgi:hypothetical protein
MRIALMIEGQEGVTWSDWVALAESAEDAGLDGLFRSDHYVGLSGDEQREATDAWAVLAALAAVTDRIRLGTLVSPVTFRHPSQLAKVVGGRGGPRGRGGGGGRARPPPPPPRWGGGGGAPPPPPPPRRFRRSGGHGHDALVSVRAATSGRWCP